MSIDFSKFKSLSINGVVLKELRIGGVLAWKEPVSYKNWVPVSIDTDGSVFNETGYQDNMRVRSGGALGSVTGYVATGYIPVKPGDVVRFTCSGWSNKAAGNTINLGYISGGVFTSVGSYTTQPATYGIYSGSSVTSENIPAEEKTGVVKFVVPNNTNITYLRMSCYGTGANLVVTINEEIT